MYEYWEASTGECKNNQIPDDGFMSRNMLEETTNMWYVDATYCCDGITQRKDIVTYRPTARQGLSIHTPTDTQQYELCSPWTVLELVPR
jgi:hypothetical protein